MTTNYREILRLESLGLNKTGRGSVKSYAQKSKQAAKEKSRYAMEESPRATSRCFMFMYFLLPH